MKPNHEKRNDKITQSFIRRFGFGPLRRLNHGPPLIHSGGPGHLGGQFRRIEKRGHAGIGIRVQDGNPNSSSRTQSRASSILATTPRDRREHRVRSTNCSQITHFLLALRIKIGWN